MGSGSMSRISLPMNWRWRAPPPRKDVARLANGFNEDFRKIERDQLGIPQFDQLGRPGPGAP